MRLKSLLLISALLCCLIIAVGCKRTRPAPVSAQEFSLALAGFAQPSTTNEILGGYLPDNSVVVKPKVLSELDAALSMHLRQNGRRVFVPQSKTKQCQQATKFGSGSTAAVDYWANVGQCLNVDFVLVPQLLYWKERVGGAAGATEPASVTFDLFVVNVKDNSITSWHRFNETQVSLTDNLLTMPEFFKRKGRWLSALELAEGGILHSLKSVGLI